MNKRLLVATHLQNFYRSSDITTHAVPTSRRDIPLAEQNFDLPDSHASYSLVFSSHHTGDILLRVVQSDLAIELISLSSDIPPVRFVFPAQILPSPSLVVWHGRQLHLIAITNVNSLYRIILPIHDGIIAWHDIVRKDWCREWQVKKLGGFIKTVHVQDFYSVVLALGSGSIIRLETDYIDGEYYSERWNETEYMMHNWYSSLLPVLPSSHPQSSEIIALASLPAPSDVTDVFSLSRDRVLRRWAIGRGCKAEIALAPALGLDSSGEKTIPLLEEGSRRYIQVFTKDVEQGVDQDQVVLVFVPTPTSTVSGGYFQSYLFPASGTPQWQLMSTVVCSESSVQCKLKDFIFSDGFLYVLWENQGLSVLEMTPFSFDKSESTWNISSYQNSSELDQSFIDELLMQPGSIPDKFMQAIFKPGIFSPSTIRIAIREYTSHHLTLEEPQPAPLLATYTSLSENIAAVVGCTVKLTHDPLTGLAQYKQYWNALRRDWEGFIAHCRVFERSTRWPLALGIGHNRHVILIERERIAHCVEEDTPIHMYRCLCNSSPIDPAFSLMDISWILRKKLNRPLINRIESETLNILHQELAFPLADIIIEASNKVLSRDDLDEGLESWVTARLSAIEDFDQVMRSVLDVVGGLEGAVKQEEDEVELILPPPTIEWQKGLICTYIGDSVEARYDLCLTIIVLLFFLGEDVLQRDPMVLAETFAVFRGIAMLRFLCRQPAGDLDDIRPSSNSHSNEDVIARFSSMNVSHTVENPSSTYSLIYRLLIHSSHGSLLPAAAHVFLDQSGLLSNITPAYATKAEVFLADRLRILGYRDLAQEILSWLPRTPAVSYCLGRLWLETGRGDDSALIFQGVAGCFGPNACMSVEDKVALSSILPAGQLFPSDFEYYLHIAELFRTATLVSYDVFFSKLAISVVPNDIVSADIWVDVIKGYIDLNLYEEAFSSLCSTPYEKTKQRFISQLVYKMCENDGVNLLTSMNFSGMSKEVEDCLSFKARNADPRFSPYYSQILYTWYIKRGDYQNGASAMYIRARKLAEFENDPSQLIGSLEIQLESLVLAMNALSILDSNNAWIAVPFDPSGSRDSRKRRKLNRYIQDDKFLSNQRDIDVLSLNDLQQEYALLVAKIELAKRDLSVFTNTELQSGWLIVSKLTQNGLFDLAMHTARALAIDMSELFQRLAVQCIRLSLADELSLLEISSDWLLTDKVSTWPGTPADRGWRYLRQSLERHDSPETDFKYSKAVFETLLSNNAGSPPPPWLVQRLEKHHPDHLIRACLRFNLLEDAIIHTLTLLRKANAKAVLPNTQASQTWIPYTLADAVLKAAETDTSSILPHIKTLRDTLSSELSDRISRLHRQSGRAQ